MTPFLLILTISSSLGVLRPAWATEEEGDPTRRFALLVGNNQGGSGRVPLRYAESDARAMAAVLAELGGVAPIDASILLGPGRSDLEGALRGMVSRLQATSNARTELIFYYSGHSDEEGLLLGGERFPYEELRKALTDMPAKVRVGILDSCASGAMVRGKGGVMRAPFLVDTSIQLRGDAFLTSSSADEAAQEADRIEASFFTQALVTGLRGAADVSRDGTVTLNEAYQYAFQATLAGTEKTAYGPQHPSWDIQLAGTGDLVMTDLRAASAGLVLGSDVDGRTSVRDPRGRLVLELAKTGGDSMELALEPGTYQVTVRQGEIYGEATVRLDAGQHTELPALSWSQGEIARARGSAIGLESAEVMGGPSSTPSAEPVGRLPLSSGGTGLRMAVVPGTPAHEEGHQDVLSLSFIGADSEVLHGFAFSPGVVTTERDSAGMALGLTGNLSEGNFRGVQISGGVNTADDADLQIAGGISMTDGDVGASQIAGGASIAEGSVNALQIGGGAAITGDELRGIQVGGGVATAGDLYGIQMTGGVAVAGRAWGLQAGSVVFAEDLRGLQVGAVDIANEVRGVQVGAVNVARQAHGMQIGVVNVADDSDLPIGLISVIKNGRHGFAFYASETDYLNLDLVMGGSHFHNIVGIGGNPGNQWCTRAGLGVELGHKLSVDIDTGVDAYLPWATDTFEGFTLVPRLRTSVGWNVWKHFRPFVGASYKARFPMGDESTAGIPGIPGSEDPTKILAWPGVFGGIEI